MRTQADSTWLAERFPAMCGKDTLAMEVSSTSMKVASVTVRAISHGLCFGFQGASRESVTFIFL